MIIRLGYCPQNPGWKWRGLKKIKWYNDVNDAINDYNGQTIWIKAGGNNYREITYQQLLNIQTITSIGQSVATTAKDLTETIMTSMVTEKVR